MDVEICEYEHIFTLFFKKQTIVFLFGGIFIHYYQNQIIHTTSSIQYFLKISFIFKHFVFYLKK